MTLRDAIEDVVKDFPWWDYGLDYVSEAQSDDWAKDLAEQIELTVDGYTD
jgi:hypothetical protein